MRMMLGAMAVLVFVLVAGCQGPETTGAAGPALSSLAGDWELSSLEGAGVASVQPEGAHRPSLSITPEGRLGGNAGINRVSGQLDASAIPQGGFATGPLATTKMAGSAEAMRFEQRYLDLLQRAKGFTLSGGTLRLLDAGRNELLTFVRGM
jgi:heat shock protein HslJ